MPACITSLLRLLVTRPKSGSESRRAIDFDDIESIKMQTLWRCIDRYDPDKGTKFTSYLYQQLSFAYKNKLKKKRREYNVEQIESVDRKTQQVMEVKDIMTGLAPEHADVLSKRFYYNMTMQEIGKSNGYSRETARRRLGAALKICKKMVID